MSEEWNPKTAKKAELKNCLVTGGSGFLGNALSKALLDRGCNVRVLDIVPPQFSHDNLEYVNYDLRNADEMVKACDGMDTVFHMAASICLMGGCGVTKEYRKNAYDINVEGTRNIITACHKTSVKRLVYTSSNNVTFNGYPKPDMQSDTPYSTNYSDLYTETKMIAEKETLAVSGEDGLLTCAIRPAGIYGAGSCIMINRVVEEVTSGKFILTVGNPNAVQDNSHADNLVHGHLLAAEYLIEGSPACGKAYFITDDEPKNNFEFFRPLVEGLGYKFPKFWIPGSLMIPIMRIWQWLHFRLKFPRPMMLPIEIEKVSITHFSNIKDARRDLGYEPVITVKEALDQCLEYVKKGLEKN